MSARAIFWAATGEEFALVLPETSIQGALVVAEHLRQRVAEEPILTTGGPIHITISVGVARVGVDVSDLSMLLDRADQALYAAKQAGRNCVMADPGRATEQDCGMAAPPTLQRPA